jgi:hypothetical protein
VLFMQLFGDNIVIKSTDNGTTWDAPRVVHDFPLDKFGADTYTYTFEDVGHLYDPAIYPDSLAILSTDETGNLFVDPLGLVHVALPTFFVLDTILDDGLYTYFIGPNLGIIYWNEEMDDDSGIINAYSPDLNNNDTLGNDNSVFVGAGYAEAFSAVPTFGMDDDGRLYMTYVAHHELYQEEENGQHHRHPFIVASQPGAYATPDDWSAPKEVLDKNLVADSIITSLSEFYFPVMARRVDSYAHIQYEHDYTFGISLRFNPVQAPEENSIEYIDYPVFIVNATQAPASQLSVALAPNPARAGSSRLMFELDDAGEARVDLLDVAGAVVRSLPQGRLNAGQHAVNIATNALADGLYFVRVQAGNRIGVRKLVVSSM